MAYQSVDELLRMPHDFDVFESPPPSSDLVRRGLHPPIPLWDGTMVVWGRRLLECAAEDVDPQVGLIPVQRIEDDAQAVLMLALALEGRVGAYGWRELSRLRELCRRYEIPIDEELSRRITGDPGFAAKVERFDRLPHQLANGVNEGLIDLRTAESLAEHVTGDLAVLLGELSHLSFSKRRQVLRLALENVRRERRQAAAGEDGASERIEAAELHGELREALSARNPVDALSRRRYPTLTELQARFEEIREHVADHARTTLEPPAYFEGEEFRFQLRFQDSGDVDRGIEALQRIKQRMHELQDLL